ncbi:hypothetical protein ALC56_13712, partial [Trachymyrmex septentrionalis]
RAVSFVPLKRDDEISMHCPSTDAPFDRHRGGEGHTEEGRNSYKERVEVVRLYASLDYVKPSHHSRLTTVQTLATIEVELMEDRVTPSCITDRFLIAEEKERARRVAEREEERKRESELNGATRGRVSILECTCRRNRTRTASEPRKGERERVVVASGKGQQPRCGRSFYLLLLKARASRRQRLLPDAMTTMVRAAVLAAVLGQLLGPSVASRPAGAHPGHAYFEQPCCGRSHLRHHKAGNEMPVSMHHQYYLGRCGSLTVSRELLLSQLSCFVADVLIEGEEVLGMCAPEGEGDEARRSNKGELETGFAWKPRAIAEAKEKYYNRCYGGDSRQGQLMLRNGRAKRPGIAPPNDLRTGVRNTTAWHHQIRYRCVPYRNHIVA